jgi:RNA polymerase sigma factor (sigma-70 family)
VTVSVHIPPRRPARVGLEDDRAWLDGFRGGDKAALARVFRTYGDDIARTVRRGLVVRVDGAPMAVGGDLPEHEVEALVQETFTKAFHPKARAAYDGLRPYGAFIATIARNLLVDRARRKKTEARVDVDDLEERAELSVEDNPTWRMEEASIQAILADAKAQLDEPDRSIFRLRFVEQKTHKETAAALSLAEITVRRRDTRMRAWLLDLFRQRGFLLNAQVSIGTSLLPRKGAWRPE